MHIQRIEALSLTSYGSDQTQKALAVLGSFCFDDKEAGNGWLVIDELCDTGKTLEWVKQKLPQAHYLVIYAKPQGKPVVDTYGRDIDQSTWIMFPWEI